MSVKRIAIGSLLCTKWQWLVLRLSCLNKATQSAEPILMIILNPSDSCLPLRGFTFAAENVFVNLLCHASVCIVFWRSFQSTVSRFSNWNAWIGFPMMASLSSLPRYSGLPAVWVNSSTYLSGKWGQSSEPRCKKRTCAYFLTSLSFLWTCLT